MARKIPKTDPDAPGLFAEEPGKVGFATLRLREHKALLTAGAGIKASAGLIASVRKLGVRIPIACRRLPSGRLTVIDGRRRIAAAVAAERPDVPAVIYQVTATGGAAITLAANYHRSANAVAELQAMEALLGTGASEKDLARELGIAIAAVRRRLKLRRLLPALRQALEDGRLALAVAERASNLDKKRQQKLVEVGNWDHEGKPIAPPRRITAADVRELTAAKTRQVADDLPGSIFSGPSAADAAGAQGAGLNQEQQTISKAEAIFTRILKTGITDSDRDEITHWLVTVPRRGT